MSAAPDKLSMVGHPVGGKGYPVAVQITHVRYGSSTRSEDSIIEYRWVDLSDGKVGESNKAAMVQYIDVRSGTVYVGMGQSRVSVVVVRPTYGAPYLRTYADGNWTNNLVNLPTF